MLSEHGDTSRAACPATGPAGLAELDIFHEHHEDQRHVEKRHERSKQSRNRTGRDDVLRREACEPEQDEHHTRQPQLVPSQEQDQLRR